MVAVTEQGHNDEKPKTKCWITGRCEQILHDGERGSEARNMELSKCKITELVSCAKMKRKENENVMRENEMLLYFICSAGVKVKLLWSKLAGAEVTSKKRHTYTRKMTNKHTKIWQEQNKIVRPMIMIRHISITTVASVRLHQ